MKRLLLTVISMPMIGVSIPIALVWYGYVARGHVRGLDYFWFALPLSPSVAGIALCICLWRESQLSNMLTGIASGLFSVSSAFCVFQAYMLISEFNGISHDGTTHWGTLQAPVVLIWMPAMCAAALVSAVAVYTINYSKSR